MKESYVPYSRGATLLAINALFLVVWGFGGIRKVIDGYPAWFPDKFGGTFLATVPGLKGAFWILTLSELVAFGLAAGALIRREFMGATSPVFMTWMLVWSLFVFVQLSLGQWLTSEFNGTAVLFAYFTGTLVSLQTVVRLGGGNS